MTRWWDEDEGLYHWIADVKTDILKGNYRDRGKIQRKLLSLEKAKRNLDLQHEAKLSE
jgi:hypothetical protein